MTPLYLIDNSNFCYKFKHVHKYAHVNISGIEIDTSVLVGYIKALRSNIFNDIVIILDGIPVDSLKILPSYKGQRNKDGFESLGIPKLEVVQFLTKVGTILNKNIRVVCSPCQEADQVISSIVSLVDKRVNSDDILISSFSRKSITDDSMLSYLVDSSLKDFDYSPFDSVVIGSTDSDMMQLISSNVMVDSSVTGKNLVSITAEAVHNLPPNAIPFYKAIFGDTSDNVPPIMDSKYRNSIISLLTLINSKEKADKLYNAIISNQVLDPFNNLVNYLFEHKLEFLRNWQVVSLRFFSVPFELSFPAYNIEETIKKYKLKV